MAAGTDVLNHGAIGDGVSNDTQAIQRAIDASAAGGVGGQVRLPPGRYLTSTLHMRSGVTLFLEAGAVLRGIEDPDAYHGYEPQGKPARWHRALILADQVENAAVAGSGVIDGGRVFDPLGEEKMRGPHTILAARCRHFTVRDVTVVDSANYAILVQQGDDIDIHNVTVQGGWDGFHIRGSAERSCQRVTVTGCRFFTGDDAIAGAWVDDLLVYNCVLNSSCNGIRWIGPARRMTIDQCLVVGPGRHPHITQDRHNTLVGVTLQPSAWSAMPGELDDVRITNVTMHNVECALMIFAKPPSRIGRVHAERITATGVYGAACSVESWAEEPVGCATFRDVSVGFSYPPGSVGEPGEITEPGRGARTLPAWGLYARRVDRLILDNVNLDNDRSDARPPLMFDKVTQSRRRDIRTSDDLQQNGPH